MSKVLFVAPVYNYDPILVPALRLQTHRDWELLLVHDGPNETGLEGKIRSIGDPRVRYYCTPDRINDWGHSLRALAMQEIREEPIDGDHVVITNGDNYYAPGFCEQMLQQFEPDIVAAYCSMSHSHKKWMVIDAELRHQNVDCGCVMATREAALATGWTSRDFSADWLYVRGMLDRYGPQAFRKVPNVLFVHN
jgi:hypothetical protein